MESKRFITRWLWGLLPLILLAALVGGVLLAPPLGGFQAAFLPMEELTIERVALSPGRMAIYVTNGGPEPVTIAQVMVDEAYWPFEIQPGPTVPRLGKATINLAYPWVQGEPHTINLVTKTGLTFAHTIEVATETPRPDARYLSIFTLLGVYVGVIPVFLGLLWYPFLRRVGPQWMAFFLSLTAGLLTFLGVDALDEALEVSGGLPSAFQDVSLVLIGVVITALSLVALSRRIMAGADPARQRLTLAYLVALGIGLHNLGEGLAIGAAYTLGKVALGSLLVVGFTIHNITEGLGIVAPVAKERVTVGALVGMGLLAGLPTIPGAWFGGLSYSPVLATLFLAMGAGAAFQVVYELILFAIRQEQPGVISFQAAGFAVGLLFMYLTGLLVPA